MAALSATVYIADVLRKAKVEGQSFEIENTDIVFPGSAVQIGDVNHATAASRGRAAVYTGAVGEMLMGLAVAGGEDIGRDGLTGDTTATPPPRVLVDIDGGLLRNVLVTGASTINLSVGRVVWLNDTDNVDADLTLTKPTRGTPFGYILRYRSSSQNDVYMFSHAERRCLEIAAIEDQILVGIISGVSGGGGTFATGLVAGQHMDINSIFGQVVEPLVTAGADLSVNLEIGAVNITGGVIPWVLANAAGTKAAGTAITALNVVHEGDLIDIEIAETSASTAGLMAIYADVTKRFGH